MWIKFLANINTRYFFIAKKKWWDKKIALREQLTRFFFSACRQIFYFMVCDSAFYTYIYTSMLALSWTTSFFRFTFSFVCDFIPLRWQARIRDRDDGVGSARGLIRLPGTETSRRTASDKERGPHRTRRRRYRRQQDAPLLPLRRHGQYRESHGINRWR